MNPAQRRGEHLIDSVELIRNLDLLSRSDKTIHS